jgi:hypothetical protein
MWQSPYLYEPLQIHCSTVAQAQYVVPWHSTCLHGHGHTTSIYTITQCHSLQGHLCSSTHEHTDVFVGSVNAFKLCRFGLGQFLLPCFALLGHDSRGDRMEHNLGFGMLL